MIMLSAQDDKILLINNFLKVRLFYCLLACSFSCVSLSYCVLEFVGGTLKALNLGDKESLQAKWFDVAMIKSKLDLR